MIEPIIIRKKGLLNFLYLVGALIFTILCIYFVFSNQSFLSSGRQALMNLLRPVLFVGIFFFGLGSVYFAKRMFQNKPILQVDETGVTDASSAIALGHIPWEDIADIKLTYYLNQTYISIATKRDEKYLAGMNFLQRNASKANLHLGFPLINITLNTSNVNPKIVFLDIENRFGHYYKDK